MLTLPTWIIAILRTFAPLFTRPVFHHVQILILGAILTPGHRTVANALRAMGLQDRSDFQNFHRVLNRARWSSLQAARLLLNLLISTFVGDGPLVIGIDETLERRRGSKIQTLGIYRDATRSSRSRVVRSSGLRWICMMVLCEIPFAARVWALPFLSVLAPSPLYNQTRGHRHKTLTCWAQQMVAQLRRWVPLRPIVLVGDSSYSSVSLLSYCNALKHPVRVVTRLQWDAALYEFLPICPPTGAPKRKGRPPLKGKRLPTPAALLADTSLVWSKICVPRLYQHHNKELEIFSATCIWYHSGKPPVPIRYVLVRDPQDKFEPMALLCTDLSQEPLQILSWFAMRWQVETTFNQVRAHLGVETQRQWNGLAIARWTPALMGLFSLVTVLAHEQSKQQKLSVRRSAWYAKENPTFSDALASVRRELWTWSLFCTCPLKAQVQEIQGALLRRFSDVLCYAP